MNGISVDKDFARFGQKSYAINKINSLEVRPTRPYTATGGVIFGGIGAVIVIAGVANIGTNFATALLSFIFGGIFLVIAWLLFQRSQTVLYNLYLMTSSSEVQAYKSFDGEEVEGLRDQIEAAMTGRL
jgi:hypothetical protein